MNFHTYSCQADRYGTQLLRIRRKKPHIRNLKSKIIVTALKGKPFSSEHGMCLTTCNLNSFNMTSLKTCFWKLQIFVSQKNVLQMPTN